MKRRVFNIACAVSLVLALAAVGVWVRSHYALDVWRETVGADGHGAAWGSWKGRFGRMISFPHSSTGQRMYAFTTGETHYLSLLRLFAVLPFLWLLVRAIEWEQRRRNPQKCGNCGYDLRATPGRCPECGTEAAGRE